MICVSLGLSSVSDCLKALRNIDFAEIRLDLMKVRLSDIPGLFSTGKRLIATCRPGTKSDSTRKKLLLECIRRGAAFVDIEHDAEDGYRASIFKEARRRGTSVILSYHNYDFTPPLSVLKSVIRQCIGLDADYVKIACRADSPSDTARLLGLLGDPMMKDRLIIVGMGRSGRAVRIFAPFQGSPFTYASYGRGEETAPGQFSAETLKKIFGQLKGFLRE